MIMGVSPFGSAHTVYTLKTRDVKDQTSVAADTGAYVELATVPYCRDQLAAHYGDPDLKISRRNQFRTHPDRAVPLSCTFDGEVIGYSELCEAKSSGLVNPFADVSDWGEAWSDEVPDHVLLQCQAQMAVMGPEYRKVWVPVMLHGRGLQMFVVIRDDELVAMVEQAAVRFWEQHVVPRVPPTPRDFAAVQRIRRPEGTDLGEPVELDSDELFLRYHEASEAAKAAEQRLEEVKAEIFELLPDDRRLIVSPAGHKAQITCVAAKRMPPKPAYTRDAYFQHRIYLKTHALPTQA
jgi:hypothetical protein